MRILPLQQFFQRKGPGIVIALKAVHAELPEDIPHTCGLDTLDADPCTEESPKADETLHKSAGGLFFSMSHTKLRSILIVSKGISLRMSTEEKPVPKSSSAMRMPLDFSLMTTFFRSSRSSSLQRSVTSRQTWDGGHPCSFRICSTRSANSGFSSWE